MPKQSKGPAKAKKTSVRNRPRFFKRCGPETVLTPELQATVIQYLGTGAYVETAASAAGISRRTFQQWVKRGGKGEELYAQFLRAVEQAMERADIDALASISRCGYGIKERGPDGKEKPGGKYLLEPDWKALAYRLSRRSTAQQEHKAKLEIDRLKLENETMRVKLDRLLTGADGDPSDPDMVELQKAKLRAEVARLQGGGEPEHKGGPMTLTVVLGDFDGPAKGAA